MSKGRDMRDPRDTYQNQLVPMVVEQTNRGERAYDTSIFCSSWPVCFM